MILVSKSVIIDLKASLLQNPSPRQRPLKFHERTGHVLPSENNVLQLYVSEADDFTVGNNIAINTKNEKNVVLQLF